MKRVIAIFIFFLLMPSFIPAEKNPAIKENSPSIVWGEMQGNIEKEIVKVKRYELETIKINISYHPFFFQYFPVIGEIWITDAPPWLYVTTSVKEFSLLPGEVKTIDIYLIVNEEIKNGTTGEVNFEIDGRTIVFSGFLEILPAYPSFYVIKA